MSAVRVQVCIQASMCAQRLLQCVYAACTHIIPGWLNVFVTGWGQWSDLYFVIMRPICGYFTEMFFLDPTFFPRLSYSVGEKMLGTNARSHLFDENWTLFFSQYFRTVPTSVISCACFVNEYSGRLVLLVHFQSETLANLATLSGWFLRRLIRASAYLSASKMFADSC